MGGGFVELSTVVSNAKNPPKKQQSEVAARRLT